MADPALRLMPEVTKLAGDQLRKFIEKRACKIVRETPGTPEDASWDDPEEWHLDAAELAHAVVHYFDGQLS